MKCEICGGIITPDSAGNSVCAACGHVAAAVAQVPEHIHSAAMQGAIVPQGGWWRQLSRGAKTWLTLGIVVGSAALLGGGAYGTHAYIASLEPEYTETVFPRNSAESLSRQAETPAATSTPTQAASPAAPAPCTKGNYVAASAQNTALSGTGYKEQIDPPQYYAISGDTVAAINEEMYRCSPFANPEGGTFSGQVDSWVVYDYKWTAETSGMCRVTSANVLVHVTVGYPKWAASATTTPGVVDKWASFIKNLELHENGHRDNAALHARQLYDGLLALPATNCTGIEQAATSYADAKIAAMKAADVAYDAQTQHGVTQGAILQ
jgi:predicted secreted Zn-dependent protease